MAKKNILIAAGGTGGHLFPALAVGQEIEDITNGDVKLIFMGTESRIESRKIPELGYDYYSMPITGFPGMNPKVFSYPYKLFKSIGIAKRIIKKNNIDALICAGAYISVPPGLAASNLDIPIFLMESNINLGKANKMLSSKANLIFTSYERTTDYLDDTNAKKALNYGNPVRRIVLEDYNKEEAYEYFGLDPEKKTILIMGGSLGASAINKVIENEIKYFEASNAQFVWQTGSNYEVNVPIPDNVVVKQFINNMGRIYSISDIVVSRSGATAVSELCVKSKPSILIPMPGSSNNEQYLNAKNLSDNNAAILLLNDELEDKLVLTLNSLIQSEKRQEELKTAISRYGNEDAAKKIANKILETIS